ncbi:stage V sporulation protein AD, partial [Bacillus cereus]|nr:stage V sporulation protein AD [Bacillus cereus]
DLLNQTVTANYVTRKWGISVLVMFSASATSMEPLAVGSALIDGGFANRVLATVSSNNATAERQFRFPTEYSGQKPGTANSPVTGAGAIL